MDCIRMAWGKGICTGLWKRKMYLCFKNLWKWANYNKRVSNNIYSWWKHYYYTVWNCNDSRRAYISFRYSTDPYWLKISRISKSTRTSSRVDFILSPMKPSISPWMKGFRRAMIAFTISVCIPSPRALIVISLKKKTWLICRYNILTLILALTLILTIIKVYIIKAIPN